MVKLSDRAAGSGSNDSLYKKLYVRAQSACCYDSSHQDVSADTVVESPSAQEGANWSCNGRRVALGPSVAPDHSVPEDASFEGRPSNMSSLRTRGGRVIGSVITSNDGVLIPGMQASYKSRPASAPLALSSLLWGCSDPQLEARHHLALHQATSCNLRLLALASTATALVNLFWFLVTWQSVATVTPVAFWAAGYLAVNQIRIRRPQLYNIWPEAWPLLLLLTRLLAVIRMAAALPLDSGPVSFGTSSCCRVFVAIAHITLPALFGRTRLLLSCMIWVSTAVSLCWLEGHLGTSLMGLLLRQLLPCALGLALTVYHDYQGRLALSVYQQDWEGRSAPLRRGPSPKKLASFAPCPPAIRVRVGAPADAICSDSADADGCKLTLQQSGWVQVAKAERVPGFQQTVLQNVWIKPAEVPGSRPHWHRSISAPQPETYPPVGLMTAAPAASMPLSLQRISSAEPTPLDVVRSSGESTQGSHQSPQLSEGPAATMEPLPPLLPVQPMSAAASVSCTAREGAENVWQQIRRMPGLTYRSRIRGSTIRFKLEHAHPDQLPPGWLAQVNRTVIDELQNCIVGACVRKGCIEVVLDMRPCSTSTSTASVRGMEAATARVSQILTELIAVKPPVEVAEDDFTTPQESSSCLDAPPSLTRLSPFVVQLPSSSYSSSGPCLTFTAWGAGLHAPGTEIVVTCQGRHVPVTLDMPLEQPSNLRGGGTEACITFSCPWSCLPPGGGLLKVTACRGTLAAEACTVLLLADSGMVSELGHLRRAAESEQEFQVILCDLGMWTDLVQGRLAALASSRTSHSPYHRHSQNADLTPDQYHTQGRFAVEVAAGSVDMSGPVTELLVLREVEDATVPSAIDLLHFFCWLGWEHSTCSLLADLLNLDLDWSFNPEEMWKRVNSPGIVSLTELAQSRNAGMAQRLVAIAHASTRRWIQSQSAEPAVTDNRSDAPDFPGCTGFNARTFSFPMPCSLSQTTTPNFSLPTTPIHATIPALPYVTSDSICHMPATTRSLNAPTHLLSCAVSTDAASDITASSTSSSFRSSSCGLAPLRSESCLLAALRSLFWGFPDPQLGEARHRTAPQLTSSHYLSLLALVSAAVSVIELLRVMRSGDGLVAAVPVMGWPGGINALKQVEIKLPQLHNNYIIIQASPLLLLLTWLCGPRWIVTGLPCRRGLRGILQTHYGQLLSQGVHVVLPAFLAGPNCTSPS